MQITGGRVVYSRTVQPAPYESKKAEVELSFLLEDGDPIDAALDDVKDAVVFHCMQMVNNTKKE